MLFLTRTFIAVIMVLIFAGCGFKKDREAAAKSVDAFHQEFNDSKFTEMYSAASPAFKTAAKEAEFMKFIQAVRRKLGAYKTGSQNGWRTNATTSGTFVVLTYNSAFEQGSAVETFTFVISGDSATLQGYHVDSRALIAN